MPNPMRYAPSFPRQQPVGGYDYFHINAAQASSTPIGNAASSGQFLGRIVVSNAGTGCTLTLTESTGGSARTIAVLPVAAGVLEFGIRVPGGLYYTFAVGSGSPDLLIAYLDMAG